MYQGRKGLPTTVTASEMIGKSGGGEKRREGSPGGEGELTFSYRECIRRLSKDITRGKVQQSSFDAMKGAFRHHRKPPSTLAGVLTLGSANSLVF